MASESVGSGTRYRALSSEEISKLTEQGCCCDDWKKVQVADGFDTGAIKSTQFSGEVKLGVFDKQISFAGGIKKSTGISNATIHNCTIGDNVYINKIKNYIANYEIEDYAVIENVDLLAVEGESSFGNGVEVAVINEAGGREVMIYDNLSAQVAYITACYRHRPRLIGVLKKMIADYAKSVSSSVGVVGKGAKIVNCGTVRNVKAGAASVIEGASRLENGSVNSCKESRSYIGTGVIAEDFICNGSKIVNGVIISQCFIGQGVILDRQFSAENSVFFANSECFGGEACSVFAGPFTVTHHKSTLLIAGLFSFFNAGSGTNQSNHLYKLGPVHQGIVERGVKTGSDSYILWPARVGAFSVVVGRHYGRADTSDFPFSYLSEAGGESLLVPGTNLRKIGLLRDVTKWPKRDRRKSSDRLDLINFKFLNPATIQKVLTACQLLSNHKAKSEGKDYLECQGVRIRCVAIESGIKFYQMAIDRFLGDCLIKHLRDKELENIDELREKLRPLSATGAGIWVDLAGLCGPEEAVQDVCERIENASINSLEQLREVFQSMHEQYEMYEWTFAMNILQRRLGKGIEKITAADIVDLITKWKAAYEKFGNLLIADAQKEFSEVSRVGYGVDGDEQIKQSDFEQVRGRFEENSVICEIKARRTEVAAVGDELISRIKKL